MSYAVEKAIKLARESGTWEELAEKASKVSTAKPLAEFAIDGEVVKGELGGRYRYLSADAYPIMGPAAELAELAALSSVPPGPVRVRIVVERREAGDADG